MTLPTAWQSVWDRLQQGERVLLNDTILDQLAAYFAAHEGADAERFFRQLATMPNPQRLGLQDRYVGWLTPARTPAPRFALGQTVATPGALQALAAAGQSPSALLERHVRGDWGLVEPEDAQANDDALHQGGRLLSVYATVLGTRLWVLTEHDRSVTTLLLPDEY
jgi:hypothetical protein